MCDSIIVLEVTIRDTSFTALDSTICQGDFVSFNGQMLTEEGIYRDTLSNAVMCDSFLVLTLTVNDTSRTNLDSTICQGDFVSFNGQMLTEEGIYRDTLSNAVMCDSFLVLTLTVNDTSRTNLDSTICQGDFVSLSLIHISEPTRPY